MKRGAGSAPAEKAVENMFGLQRHDRETRDNEGGGRRRRGRSSNQSAGLLGEETLSRLAEQAEGQQRVLLSRLVSHDPTKKARPLVVGNTGGTPDVRKAWRHEVEGVTTVDASSARAMRKRRDGGICCAPITFDEFDQKYVKNDPMLRYLLHVIAKGLSVTRADIPRRHGTSIVRRIWTMAALICLSFRDAIADTLDPERRFSKAEEDVLFLAYHRGPPCGFRNVYWLEFITEERAVDVEFEYFTLSHHGLTHYRGSTVIDFIDIECWVMEKRAFDHMTTMRGLQKLQGLLFFMSWKKKAIRMKHRRIRARLACSLFHCDLAASRLMVRVREYCVEIENLATATHLPTDTTFTLDQLAQRNHARLKHLRSGVLQNASRICAVVDDGVGALRQLREAEIEAEKQNYANVSRSSRLLDRLYVFLRLVDLLLVESISAHMEFFITSLHNSICGSQGYLHQRNNESPVEHSQTIVALKFSEGNPIAVVYQTVFSLRHRKIPSPFIFAQLIENVELGNINSEMDMQASPSKLDVFNLVYGFLNGYISFLDATPQVLADKRFRGVMAPYTPQNRDVFLSSLARPSTQVLELQSVKLKELKYAIETYYKQLEIQVSELSHLLEAVFAAEENERHHKTSNEAPERLVSTNILTAAQFEEIRNVWEVLLQDIKATPRCIQVGVLLLDQTALLNRVEDYVVKHIREMLEELPYVYKQFLCDLLADVDGRIEKVTNIPTSISEAIQWLREMMDMMPTHSFRQAFDFKCANLSRLKQLLKANSVKCRTKEDEEFVRKKDFEWESIYETLLICFARVQEKDSEHRRSVQELSAKADEYITAQLDRVKSEFTELPSHQDELLLNKRKTKELGQKKQELISLLERLVEIDGEREDMLEMYSTFELEQRLLTDPDGFEPPESHQQPTKLESKSTSELLLQHVSIVIDMRAWFCSWSALEDKWLDTPLTTLHPSIVLSRLKQFRRRLLFASTRLLPASSATVEDSFIERDYQLVRDIQDRVDQMASDYIILQAALCGAFTRERWIPCKVLLDLDVVDHTTITLRMIKARSITAPGAVMDFKQLCEVVVVEAKLRNVEQILRQRMATSRVTATSTSFRVILENIEDVVLELSDIEIEAMLLVQPANPNLESSIAFLDVVRTQLSLCDRLLSFQSAWNELCQLTRIHDIDEFFTGQVAWNGPIQRQKKKVGRDESIWVDFLEVAQEWADRLRRLVCICQSYLPPTIAQNSDAQANPTVVSSKFECELSEVQEAFQGFDFNECVAKCEHAHQLVDRYITNLCEKCPRLYGLSKKELIRMLVNDDDLQIIQRSLSRCYPGVTSFNMTRGRKQDDELLHGNGLSVTHGDQSDGTGAVSIRGMASALVEQRFNVPVVKVGRLRFWLTRLEEEMASVVMENAKQAVSSILSLVDIPSQPVSSNAYKDQFPQSTAVALSVLFTSGVRRALGGRDSTSTQDRSMELRFGQWKSNHAKLLEEVVSFAANASHIRNDWRLDSMILILSYQSEVLERLQVEIATASVEYPMLTWEAHFKIDFIIEDLSVKTTQRVRQCDSDTWSHLRALGPSFPISFVGSIGQSEFYLGHELAHSARVPVVTPLTERCIFEILQAVRSPAISLVAPISGYDSVGHQTTLQGIATMLMKPFYAISYSRGDVVHVAWLDNLLKLVATMGTLLSLNAIDSLSAGSARILIEKLKQVRQDVVHKAAQAVSPIDQRTSIASFTGCVFVPLSGISSATATSNLMMQSIADAFHPVAVVLLSIEHYTRVMALVAGFPPETAPTLKPVFTFFEGLSKSCSLLKETSSHIHQFIAQIMLDASQLRDSCRVLLPSNAKWSQQFPSSIHKPKSRRVSTLFRRSADGHDTSDVVVHTLFCHVIGSWRKHCLEEFAKSESDEVLGTVCDLLRTCFPKAEGCEIIEAVSRSKDEALWDALDMAFSATGLCGKVEILEKVTELSSILERSATVVLLGSPGSGKSTCLKTLHQAMQALEMTEGDADDGNDTPTERRADGRDISRLGFVSSHFIDDGIPDECLDEIIRQCFSTEGGEDAKCTRRWLCVDGVLDSTRIEALQFSRRVKVVEKVSQLLSTEYPRTIFETTSLLSASPALLIEIRILHIPQMHTQADLLASWRSQWAKRLPFPEDSKGYENVERVFHLVEAFMEGPVRAFICAEETESVTTGSSSHSNAVPAYFGMLPVQHLTQTYLQLVASSCFAFRSQLEELSAAQISRLVAFCAIWGFTGHLSEFYRQKFDQMIRPYLKQMGEMKLGGDVQGDLFDSEHLGNRFWESIQLPLRGESPAYLLMKDQIKSTANRVIHDSMMGNRILVLSNGATSLVRVLRLLLRSSHSFMLVGPKGSGKSSLLRLLWLMNDQDQTSEAMIDASLDHRFAPDALNWQSKPRPWFEYPNTHPADTRQHRSRAKDESLLFAYHSAGAPKFVFLDDVGMSCDSGTGSAQVYGVDEFVRMTIDHQVAVNWTQRRMLPISKNFAASMVTHKPALPRVRVSEQSERLMRHFCVFGMPAPDRQHLQGIFREAYADFFMGPTAKVSPNEIVFVPRAVPHSERVLSMSEVVLRACVDLTIDVFTVQQTTDSFQLIEGFRFNLHHLDALLRRSLSFTRLGSTSGNSDGARDSGATLLSLGKVHQCWVSSVRELFLEACLHRAPKPPAEETPPTLGIDEVKKVVQATKMASEKHFSVPIRDEAHAALVTDIVYGSYRYLITRAGTSCVNSVMLEELLTSNASASSSSGGRRKAISEATTGEGVGSIIARDEYAINVARGLVFEHVNSHLSQDEDGSTAFSAATRLALRLHMSSTIGLHQVLHMLQAVDLSANVLVDDQLTSNHRNVIRLAFKMEKFEVVELVNLAPGEHSRVIESALISAASGSKRIALWIDVETANQTTSIRETIVAACSGRAIPVLYESDRLRHRLVSACVQDQQTIRLLSDEDITIHFRGAIKHNLRLCVFSNGKPASSNCLVELMRGSAAFQWVSFARIGDDSSRYRGEVLRRAVEEMCDLRVSSTSREVSSNALSNPVWRYLHSKSDEVFGSPAPDRNEDAFISFVTNCVADYKRRESDVAARITERTSAVERLRAVQDRIPRLDRQVKSLIARSDQLNHWHNELLIPLEELTEELRERVHDLNEQEAELAGDELRALQRRMQKLEAQVWAHKAAICEYDLARTEIAYRQRELIDEMRHWEKYEGARQTIEARFADELRMLQARKDPVWLVQRSCKATSRMYRTSESDTQGESSPPLVSDADDSVCQLWRARFPFLAESNADHTLLSIDSVCDRIPLIVDSSGLCQYILVHIFSNAPWFSDANDEHERHEAVGVTFGGAIAPVVIQCDGSDKMWQKLLDAAQKEIPTLLVGVKAELIHPLTIFARQHSKKERSNILRQLTQEAYRFQLKRSSQQKTSILTSDIVMSVISKESAPGKTSTLSDVWATGIKPSGTAAGNGATATRRKTIIEAMGSPTRRASIVLAGEKDVVAAPKGLGFQLYAVTQQGVDAKIVAQSGSFTLFRTDWDSRSVESFYNESWIRRVDKKLHKELMDARRVKVDGAYRVSQAEAVMWPLVQSHDCLERAGREAFMHHLEELTQEYTRYRSHVATAQTQLVEIDGRRRGCSSVGGLVALVAHAAMQLTTTVAPRSSIYARSYRFYEQILDTTAIALLKHAQASQLLSTRSSPGEEYADLVASRVFQTVLVGLMSSAHRRIFAMTVASNWPDLSPPQRVATPIASPIVAWLRREGLARWCRQLENQRLPSNHWDSSDSADGGENGGATSSTELNASPSHGAMPATTCLSLVERLRRKVRVCALIFEQVAGSRDKTTRWETDSSNGPIRSPSSTSARLSVLAPAPRQTALQDAQPPSVDPRSRAVDEAHAAFRLVARALKTLWCEWKLAREDQRGELQHAITTFCADSRATCIVSSGLQRRRQSGTDLTLASSSVTQVLSLRAVAAFHLGLDKEAGSTTFTFEQHLGVAMLAKVYFPQLFASQWDACTAARGPAVSIPGSQLQTTPTSRILLGLASRSRDAQDAESALQLPPTIDVAWRRDDLVHLPTRVLTFERPLEQTAVEVLLLRARDPASSSPLRVFTIVAFGESESRLRVQLTAAVTNKERFAVEISQADQFDSVIALVSQVVNQHALLCIPEWYVLCDSTVSERLDSPVAGYLYYHAVMQATEPLSVRSQLAQWLSQNAGLGEQDASSVASGLLTSARGEQTLASHRSLSNTVEALVGRLKAIANSGESAARQRQLKQFVVNEFALDAAESREPRGSSTHANDKDAHRAKVSLEFIADLILLPRQTSAIPAEADAGLSYVSDADAVTLPSLPEAVSTLAKQLDALCTALCPLFSHPVSERRQQAMASQGVAAWWMSTLEREHNDTINCTRSLCRLLLEGDADPAERPAAQRAALVRNGLVPVDWIMETFPILSSACFSNVVSVPQVLVLVLSRLGFLLQCMDRDQRSILHVSLLSDPKTVLKSLQHRCAATMRCDASELEFVLELAVKHTNDAERTGETKGTASAQVEHKRERRHARRGSVQKVTRLPVDAEAACVAVDDDGQPCGIQIEGLVAAERVTTTSPQADYVYLHQLPACRLKCQRREPSKPTETTASDTDRVTSSRPVTVENLVHTFLKQEGIALTTIVSTSAFQTLPDSFWRVASCPGYQSSDGVEDSSIILRRVVFSSSLLAALPSLSRQRGDRETSTIVLAVPVFCADDDDHAV